jgi:large subunit ribosomal protein L9
MKVILNDFVEGLGERGDVVTVKPGYARNYLVPKKLAYLDSPGNQRRFEEEQSHWVEMDLERNSAAEKMAEAMTGVELLFERRAGEKDVLFGSVSVTDVASGLADKGFEVDKRRIQLEHPLKELGSFGVPVHIHREVTVTIPVHVVRPGEKPGSPVPAPVVDDAELAAAVVEAAVEPEKQEQEV